MPQNVPIPKPAAQSPILPRRTGCLVAFLLVVAAAIRILCAFNDLWLDEIWSLVTVRRIASPLDVFTKIHIDNNHYLTSLWLYFFRDHGNWPGYRAPAIIAGLGCVALAFLIARRQSPRAGFIAMFLVASSYVQILYSSEARGYSEVVFFSFAAAYALDKYLETADWRYALAFSVCSILGFAADILFLNFYCAAFVWSAWRWIKSRLAKARVAQSILACHAAPAAFFVALYFLDLRHLVVGGGTPATLSATYLQSLAWTFGAASGGLGVVSAVLAVALFIAALFHLWRQRSDSLLFYLGVIVVFPILLVLLHHSDTIYVRYFMVGMSFMLILFSFALAALWLRGPRGRLACVLVLTAWFALNAWHTATLLKFGRGHYAGALQYLIENTSGPDLTIGSDHDFRVSLVLQFYVQEATGDKTVKYYQINTWPAKGPEWVIHHKESFENPVPDQTRFTDPAGNAYQWVKTFPTTPLSGLHWFIFHKLAPNPGQKVP